MRILTPLAVAAFALVSATSFAAPTPPVSDEAPVTEDAAKPAKKPRKICRTETATGSVMAKRKCYTPEQLKGQQRQTEQDLRNLKK